MNNLIILVGDSSAYLGEHAKKIDKKAYLINLDNVNERHSGVVYTSIGDLGLEKFITFLSNATEIKFCPPFNGIWTDKGNIHTTYSMAWLSMYYCIIISTIKSIPLHNTFKDEYKFAPTLPKPRISNSANLWIAGCSTTAAVAIDKNQVWWKPAEKYLNLPVVDLSRNGSSISYDSDQLIRADLKKGGTVTISVPHEDGKVDFSAEVSALSSAGGEVLVVVGYLDQGGKGIVQASLDAGAFDIFVLPDAMIGDALLAAIGPQLNGSFGQLPGTDSEGFMQFIEMETDFKNDAPFAASSYDAAALMLLAMQAANSSDPADYQSKVFDVANAPGVEIGPGELGKALELLADGQEIDYVGASDIELIGPGENGGRYREIIIADEAIETVGYR